MANEKGHLSRMSAAERFGTIASTTTAVDIRDDTP
jgi:hypothetical protein